MIYLIGSLRNPEVPVIANKIRDLGLTVFDDWYAAGPEADDKWREYEIARGHTYQQALTGLSAQHVFGFDKRYLDQSHTAVLVLPAGKSGHLELGYMVGKGKKGYILLEENSDKNRFDVMYQFATAVCYDFEELAQHLESDIEASAAPSSAPFFKYGPPLFNHPYYSPFAASPRFA